MRNRIQVDNVTVQATAGTHVVLLGMNISQAGRKGLLGFAIRREDKTENERYWLRGQKTFRELVPNPVPGEQYPLYEHPVQTFRWADYTAKPEHDYIYEIVPMYGKPKFLVEGPTAKIAISTEPESAATAAHEVYFNRGVAGSQAYARRFGNITPDKLPAAEQQQALAWLSRGLEEAILAFIQRARDGAFSLRAAVYEFNHEPVLKAFKDAHQRGVDVKIIYDARGENPRQTTEVALKKVGISGLTKGRAANASYIAHNKFIVLLKNGKPIQVWTGSTNFTRGGIFGQSNVGHAVLDENVAKAFHDYWLQLEQDPQAKDLRTWIQNHTPDPAGPPAPNAVQALFSPRKGLKVLEWYAERLGKAEKSGHVTMAFGVHPLFEEVLGKQKAYLRYVLEERKDPEQSEWTKDRDVLVAVGGKLSGDALYGWTEEALTGFNVYVLYIHDKFMLIDPLSDDPIIISGSANFSEASTEKNDENMLVIRGDTRVADIYLGEFMRLFSHHYFRDLIRKQAGENVTTPRNAYLISDDSWADRYFKKYSVKSKERLLFSGSLD